MQLRQETNGFVLRGCGFIQLFCGNGPSFRDTALTIKEAEKQVNGRREPIASSRNWVSHDVYGLAAHALPGDLAMWLQPRLEIGDEMPRRTEERLSHRERSRQSLPERQPYPIKKAMRPDPCE